MPIYLEAIQNATVARAINKMNIKLVADGSAKWERFICRWGISFLIDEDILFDTFGDPYVFLRNCEKYNVDFSKIKHIIISHDDWDHITGLWYVINRYKNLSVYICPNFKQEIKERIKSFGVNVVEAGKSLRIRNAVYTTGELTGGFGGKIIYEQSLVIKSSRGLVVITGCAHPGIANIIDNVRKQFGATVYCVIGGLHLKDFPKEKARQVIMQFKKFNLEKIVPLHCTGKQPVQLIKEIFGDKYIKLKQGEILEI